MHADNIKDRIGSAAAARNRATHRVGHRRVLRGTEAWSPLILKAPTPLLRDQHTTPRRSQTTVNSEDLYYWSSVNPQTHSGYTGKLISFGNAVRANGGIWIAPAAPGFDARLVGGTSSIDRRDGETLRAEWNAAISSRPAAVGVISWNEFSENTHVEPSKAYGNRYLDVLAELNGAAGSPSAPVDSSEPAGTGSPWRAILAIGCMAGLIVVSLVALARRRRQPKFSARRQEQAL
jgi:hypothetical protein